MTISNETVEIILRVAKRLAPKYRFGTYTEDDIVQEAYIIAADAIEDYDPKKGSLENFLYTHLQHRLKNFKRHNYFRPVTCKYCGGGANSCEECEQKHRRQQTRQNLHHPLDVDYIEQDEEPNTHILYDVDGNLDREELLAKIDANMPVELREDYLKMLDSIYVPKSRRLIIEQTILGIING